MNTQAPPSLRRPPAPSSRRAFRAALAVLFLFAAAPLIPRALAQTGTAASAPPSSASSAQRTPTEVVREFYRAMREKRFREALAMSISRPAVESLSAQEYVELRPDFERLAGVVLEQVVISGEQLSGDTATVFGKFTEDGLNEPPKPVSLIREGGAWLVGDRDGYEAVKAAGRNYFLEARISTHHGEVESLLRRLPAAQLAYSAKYGGTYGDLPALVREGLMPADVLTPDSTGYRIYVKLDKGGRSYTAGAEPARYGRTGRLSFFADAKGQIKSRDAGGKPIK
ncbi:MAG TPA: hypothetical protein VEQ42_13885 [Pyrinomonadaceae bacterium]|nr:hypothetical protein [Pyrinomonadaceae bacterium]